MITKKFRFKDKVSFQNFMSTYYQALHIGLHKNSDNFLNYTANQRN